MAPRALSFRPEPTRGDDFVAKLGDIQNELLTHDALPAIRKSTSVPGGPFSAEATEPAASIDLPQRILVIDDEAAILQLYNTVLTRYGYRVETAEDGEAGGKVLRAARYGPDRYHLLITDHRMPKLSGVELIEQLRSESMTLPIIMASGTPPENVERLQLEAILLKPFTVAKLMQTVKAVLPRHMSNPTTPQLRRLARRLLAHQLRSSRRQPNANSAEAFTVCEKLRGPVARLIGILGFRSLLASALSVASTELPGLEKAWHVNADGSLERQTTLDQPCDSIPLAHSETVLVAHFLGLLATSVGLAITLQVLQGIWQELDNLSLE